MPTKEYFIDIEKKKNSGRIGFPMIEEVNLMAEEKPNPDKSKSQAPSPSVLFRCDGSSTIGLGHVVRCLALAEKLENKYNFRIIMAMQHSQPALQMVQQKEYQIFTLPQETSAFDYGQWLREVLKETRAQVLVLDVRDNLSCSVVEVIREQGVLVVIIDDSSDRRLAADLAFYPPVPQVQRLDWSAFKGQLYIGWEWVILRREFILRRESVQDNDPDTGQKLHHRPMVLVTMGGSDPDGLTFKAIEALDLLEDDFETVVALGPAFSYRSDLEKLAAQKNRFFDIRHNAVDMADLMLEADLAVSSFGVTAYELAVMGIPAIYLCLTPDHAESASAFSEAKIGINLGVYSQVSNQCLAEQVKLLLNQPPERYQMARLARHYVDGRGAIRIAHLIANKINKEDQ